MKKIIITFISLIIGILSRAQTVNEHYYFKNLSSQNGLSQNTVSAILQDSKGFMWFGTKDGLDRYLHKEKSQNYCPDFSDCFYRT